MASACGRLGIVAVTWLVLGIAAPGRSSAAACGSGLLLETAAPTSIDGLDAATPFVARFWEAGAGGANRNDAACTVGCTALSGGACAGGIGCLAVTGASWLNAACASAGHLPARTVFLVEQATPSSGGRWAAIDLDHNAADANTDLDAKASVLCGGCASVLSPFVGGTGAPQVTAFSVTAGVLAASLTWVAPAEAAQALSNGTNLVKSYSVFYRFAGDPVPPMTGEPGGWSRVGDLDADGSANGGFSTNTSASVEVPLEPQALNVAFAIAVNFDGSGNPDVDPNTRPSSFLSDQAILSLDGLISLLPFADGFESGDLSAWSVP